MRLSSALIAICLGATTAGCSQQAGFSPLRQSSAITPLLRSQPAFAGRPDAAGTEHVVYRFKGGKDGAYPTAGLIDVKGELYGTTPDDGADSSGTVFAVSTSGKERVLYSFQRGTDGTLPFAGLIAVGSKLYGTTTGGGANGYGTVFDVSTSGTERVLYNFKSGTDGAVPEAALISVGSELYGTTAGGGADDAGTVFEVSTSGTERVLYTFKGGTDGKGPYAGLTDVKGTLYGTTHFGGAGDCSGGCGTVFAVSTSGKERVLHSFAGGSDGANPWAGLIDVGSELYGTTYVGATSACAYGSGCGTVFEVSTSGKERVLHRFAGNPDGANPYAGLIAKGSELYGTTSFGGANGVGAAFEVSTSGKERVLHSFAIGTDGSDPWAALTVVGDELYGTTVGGGESDCFNGAGCGTVFAVTP